MHRLPLSNALRQYEELFADRYQAVLKEIDSQQVYFVELNETQNGWKLVMIAPKQVVLEKDNKQITLGLTETLFLSPKRAGEIQ